MESTRKFLHDRVVLGLVTLMAILLVIGVSIVLLRYDAANSSVSIVGYRQNSISIVSGKPIDIYSLAIFMLLISAGGVVLANRVYPIRRSVAIFLLGSTVFLLILSAIVANSLILKQ